jgi:hypothetical protein
MQPNKNKISIIKIFKRGLQIEGLMFFDPQ